MSEAHPLRSEPRGFKKLEVWQLGRQLTKVVYDLSACFPKDEDYGLRKQIRNAAVSVPSNIAEGWGRYSDGAFINALKIARGSLFEVDTQLIVAVDQKYVSESDISQAVDLIELLSRKLFNLIERVGESRVREERAPYGPSSEDQSSPSSPSSQPSPSSPVLESDFVTTH